MRTLVTGGAGFIGSHICQELLSRGHQVVAVDNLANGRLENFDEFEDSKNFEFQKIDILDRDRLAPLFKGVDWVFHMAGLADIVPSIERPDLYFDVNVKGTLNVLEAAKNAGVKRFAYAASSSSYGIPESYPTPETALIAPQYPYALTKYLGEELVLHWSQTYSLPAVSLRLFNVYGPRSRTSGTYGAVFGVFLAQKLSHKPFTVVGDGEQTRDFTYIENVVAANLSAMKSDVPAGSVINVGGGERISILELYHEIAQRLGSDLQPQMAASRAGDVKHSLASLEKAERLLGYRPAVTWRDGLATTLAWYRDTFDAPRPF